ncbi:MAG: helix-turn-helix domain-containing protein [Oscillospiraceae bacterium]|nr:helix-turn-helix domain-containing protein [Oscillospiraceae bacterium]
MVKNENYYVVHGWMLNELGLKGNELLVYAIIYGFSQGENQWFMGYRKYLADFTNCTIRSVQNILNALVEKNLIEKQERSDGTQKVVFYRAVRDTNISGKNFTPSEKNSLPPVKKFHPPSEKFSPPTIYNIIDNIEDNIERENALAPEPKKQKEIKHKFGEYHHVRLTDNQFQKLIEEYGENAINLYIKKVDEYCQQHGKSYKDYNLTIRNWMNKDNIQKVGDTNGEHIGII